MDDGNPVNGQEALIAQSASLSTEQQAFVSAKSLGAALLNTVYFFAARLPREGFRTFIPIYNLYVWYQGIVRGRRMSWDQGNWESFAIFAKRQKLLDKIGIIAAAAFVVLFVGTWGTILAGLHYAGVSWSTFSAPIAASEAFLTDVDEGDMQHAYDEATQDYRNRLTRGAYEQLYAADPVLGHIASFSITERAGGIEWAKTQGTITTDNGTEHVIRFITKKDGDMWRVDDVYVE